MTTKLQSIRSGRWTMGLALASSVFIAAGSQARADVMVDGIDLPIGATITATVIDENLITATGQTLFGVGIINSIQQNLTTTYTYGEGGNYLTFGFNNFVSSYVQGPTPSSTGYIEFTGGTAGVYLEHSAPNLSVGGVNAQATDYASATSGTLFLGVTPQSFNVNPAVATASSGAITTTTLEAIIPDNPSLLNFSNAFGSAFFDATSGDAAFNFHTCGFALAGAGGTCPADTVDMTFTESFNSGASGDFPVSGTGSIKANVVPEPGSLALLGAGLVIFAGMMARRRRNIAV